MTLESCFFFIVLVLLRLLFWLFCEYTDFVGVADLLHLRCFCWLFDFDFDDLLVLLLDLCLIWLVRLGASSICYFLVDLYFWSNAELFSFKFDLNLAADGF